MGGEWGLVLTAGEGRRSLEKDGEGRRRPEQAGRFGSSLITSRNVAWEASRGASPEASQRPPGGLLQSLPQPPRTFFCPLLSTFFTKIAQGSAPEPRALFKNCVWQELFPTLPFLPCNPPTP